MKKINFFFVPDTGFGPASGPAPAPHSVVYGAPSESRDLEITIANVKITLTQPTGGAGDITLNYTLVDVREAAARIVPQYSTDNQQNWSTCTSAGGDDGVTSLATSTAGTAHVFIWDTVTDLGIDHKGDVHVRILAYDQATMAGDFKSSGALSVNVDNAPLAPTLVSPADGWFDKDQTMTFICTIPNPNQGNSDMHVKLELDTVSTFDSENYIKFESRLMAEDSQAEYDSDGAGAWIDIPHDGIPVVATPALIGNQCRFTVPTPQKLPKKSFKWRMVFGGITS